MNFRYRRGNIIIILTSIKKVEADNDINTMCLLSPVYLIIIFIKYEEQESKSW